MTTSYLNATETMAELAWRYGEEGVLHRRSGGLFCFPDRSCMDGDGPFDAREVRRYAESFDWFWLWAESRNKRLTALDRPAFAPPC